MKIRFWHAFPPVLLICLLGSFRLPGQTSKGEQTARDWPIYGGTSENTHYSPLSQINRSNVRNLKVAWTYDSQEEGGLQTSPIIVQGVLYGITPKQKVFALNAATGKLLWKFDSGIESTQPNRGLAYWSKGSDRRILVGVMNFVYVLDATTGKPIKSFGDGGRINLQEGLGRKADAQSIALTSPGVVYKDLLIVGGREPETLPAPPGDIRAFDVVTGKLRWIFHTIPHPGEPGYETWPKDAWTYSGAANNWAGMTVDQQRGIVYVPTGSAAFDFYGANRVGDDLFANCLLALDANTGRRIWHYQAVHHDIWDRDFPSPPVLVTLERSGKTVEAVAQASKQGFVYVFDRTTGEPLFPIESHDYPASDVPGEVASKEQPLPSKPAPFARQQLTEDLLSNRNPQVHAWAVEKFRQFRSAGQFIPFSVGKDTVVFPGFDGGAEWGGSAFDPETRILYVNSNDLAWTGALASNTEHKEDGKSLYQRQCSICHRDDRSGAPPEIPALVGVGDRRSSAETVQVIRRGKGRMPAFANLSDEQVAALVEYVNTGRNKELASGEPPAAEMKYRFTGYHRFLDPDGYPAVAPPWGTLNAINLDTGEYAWKIPFGEYPALAAAGVKDTGSENYGGPIVTAGGVVFIGATNFDKQFRAYDKSTGKLLWQTTLPFAGNATPATYEVDGKQFVVIAAGGGKAAGALSGGVYVAFALESQSKP